MNIKTLTTLFCWLLLSGSCQDRTTQATETALLRERGFAAQHAPPPGRHARRKAAEIGIIPRGIEVTNEREELVVELKVSTHSDEYAHVSYTYKVLDRLGGVVVPPHESGQLEIGPESPLSSLVRLSPGDGYYVVDATVSLGEGSSAELQKFNNLLFFAVVDGEIRGIGLSEFADGIIPPE